MATLNAASRLRRDVLNIDNTVLLVQNGQPDQVIRFNRLPEILAEWRKTKAAELGLSVYPSAHTPLNLGNGPDSEAWANAINEMRSNSRRDRALPLPVAVAANSREEWSLGPEDVPYVEMNALEVIAPAPVVVEEKKPLPGAIDAVVYPIKLDKRTKEYKETVIK